MTKSFAKIFVALAFLFAISGCDRKNCSDVVCDYGMTCNQGQCYCPDGYEGTDCSTVSANKYVGSYNVNEACYTGASNFFSYPAYITNGYRINELQVSNLFGMTSAIAYVYTDASNQGNVIEVPMQSQGGLTFSGQGTFDPINYRITINFNYTYNFSSYQCTHTFYKQ